MPESTRRHQSGASKIEVKRREALSAGAVMAISAVVPIAVGTVTMIYDWPSVPFGLSCVVGVALFVSARDRLHESRVAEHIRDSEERLNRSLHRALSKIHKEVLEALRSDAIDRVTESVHDAERRTSGLRGL